MNEPIQDLVSSYAKAKTDLRRSKLAKRIVAEVLPKMRDALAYISQLDTRADDCVGMVDNPHTKALRVASKKAGDALTLLDGKAQP